MEQRTVVITGGNSGLGYLCAKNIATNRKDFTVVIACRNLDKAAVAQKKLHKETGNPNIYALELDLASLVSVRKFYDTFCTEKFPPLYGLVCNAGINNVSAWEYTKEGFELTFGVNHLGHFLLANLLLNRMQNNGRIVFVSSDMHEPPKYMMKTPVFTNAKIHAFAAKKDGNATLRYPMSKLCNILCVYEMSDRIKAETDKHITVNAFNPGLMTDTNFIISPSTHPVLRTIRRGFLNLFGKMAGVLGNSNTSGTALAALITEAQYENCTAKYYDRGKEIKSSVPSYDKTAAKTLWVESAELVKLKQSETILSIT